MNNVPLITPQKFSPSAQSVQSTTSAFPQRIEDRVIVGKKTPEARSSILNPRLMAEPPGNSCDRMRQLRRVHRLGHVYLEARGQRLPAIFGSAIGRQRNRRIPSALFRLHRPYPAYQAVAVFSEHGYV